MESKLEAKFRNKVKQAGGWALKFSSPSTDSVPDRLILLPGGVAVFAEIKDGLKKDLKPKQLLMKRKLERLGFTVWVIQTAEHIEEFLQRGI